MYDQNDGASVQLFLKWQLVEAAFIQLIIWGKWHIDLFIA